MRWDEKDYAARDKGKAANVTAPCVSGVPPSDRRTEISRNKALLDKLKKFDVKKKKINTIARGQEDVYGEARNSARPSHRAAKKAICQKKAEGIKDHDGAEKGIRKQVCPNKKSKRNLVGKSLLDRRQIVNTPRGLCTIFRTPDVTASQEHGLTMGPASSTLNKKDMNQGTKTQQDVTAPQGVGGA